MQSSLLVSALGSGACLFLASGSLLVPGFAAGDARILVAAAAVTAAALAVSVARWRGGARVPSPDAVAALGAVSIATVFVLAALVQLGAMMRLPADLLSFSESPFLTDLIKLRLGTPLYTPAEDNNSYPYTPGTQLLTYGLASLVGKGDSLPWLRAVQFGYVILAACLAASAAQLLSARLLPDERRSDWVWLPLSGLVLFLVATDPTFSLYVHTLHNDGLAMLISATGFWLIVRHAVRPGRWLLAPMVLLPAVGFLVKQNQLMWIGLFWIHLALSGALRLRGQIIFLAVAGGLALAVVAGCVGLWGEDFVFWIFRALGDKQVALGRSVDHLLMAGLYLALGLVAGWVLLLRDGLARAGLRPVISAWLVWLLVFGAEAFTSGIGWQVNHLGPGILLATAWFLVALRSIWPRPVPSRPWWERWAAQGVVVGALVGALGSLGLAREPWNPVPADMRRYIADIEREFEGQDPARVLQDNGSWIYYRENVLVKDRSSPVALHVGMNQPEIGRQALAATIRRIDERAYDRILARHVEPEGEGWHTWYDYQDRGSGVKDAILRNYRVVRKIPGARGVRQASWLPGLYAEVWVFEPKEG